MVAVVNDVACHLLGFGCEELVGKNIDDIVASGAADLGTAVDQEDFEVDKAKAAAKVVVSGKVVRLQHAWLDNNMFQRIFTSDYVRGGVAFSL